MSTSQGRKYAVDYMYKKRSASPRQKVRTEEGADRWRSATYAFAFCRLAIEGRPKFVNADISHVPLENYVSPPSRRTA
jgi:hypothetical protein